MSNRSAIVIGAGIVGLAMARSLSLKGYRVKVFERHEKAIGASIRNFGMIWPIGQPDGYLYERALTSKNIWKEILEETGSWYSETGSLHLGYSDLESDVLKELAGHYEQRGYQNLDPSAAQKKSSAINTDGLTGALWSPNELVVESRKVIEALPQYLESKFGVEFFFNTAISNITGIKIYSGNRSWEADRVFVCSGADFETLYPEIFQANQFTKCKLQMMRIVTQPDNFRIGPSLCGGLSLIHYKSFAVAPHFEELKNQMINDYPEYVKWGIHVMVSQNEGGELTVGDTHEYGLTHDPFDKAYLNDLVLAYLRKFLNIKDWKIAQTWNGIYPKRTNGEVDFIDEAEPGVTIVNGLGGNGMTLSFGLAEEVVNSIT